MFSISFYKSLITPFDPPKPYSATMRKMLKRMATDYYFVSNGLNSGFYKQDRVNESDLGG